MVCYLSSQAPMRGSGQKKIIYIIGGGGDKKIFREKNKPVNCERSLSSLLDGIMNKEIFIRTVNLILLTFFFQHAKPTKKKGKKTGKGIEIDLSEILIYYSTTAVVSSYTI